MFDGVVESPIYCVAAQRPAELKRETFYETVNYPSRKNWYED